MMEGLRVHVRALMLLLVTGLSATSLYSQEIYDAIRLSGPGFTFNAPALGMGNAYSTIGYDFSAVRLNPATLGLSRNAAANWSINTNFFPGTTRREGSAEQFFSTSSTSFSQAGLIAPFGGDSTGGGFVLAAGFTQSKDFNQSMKYSAFHSGTGSIVENLTMAESPLTRSLGLSYEVFDPGTGQYVGDATIINGQLNETGFMYDQGGLVHISLAAAYEVAPSIFVGVSGSYATGTYVSDREYFEADSADIYGANTQTNPADPLTADFQEFYLHDVRSNGYTGWDLKLGVLYKFYNFIGISASFKVPLPHTITETRNISGYAVYGGGRTLEANPVETTIKYKTIPAYEATVGAMVNLWFLTGALEATYVDYTSIDFPSGLALPVRTLALKQIKEKFTPVINLNGGVEFRLPFTGIVGRAGFMYRPSPLKDDPMEYDTKVVTAGLGINSADRLQFDLGYALGLWTQRGDRYGVEGVTQEVVTHDLLVSMKFRF
jgi:hypothetical protein